MVEENEILNEPSHLSSHSDGPMQTDEASLHNNHSHSASIHNHNNQSFSYEK